MNDKERDAVLLILSERTAWIAGKLEEVHLRTSEIPRLADTSKEARLHIKLLWAAVIAGIVATAPAVFAAARALIS